MTKVMLRLPLANHCSRVQHTARECPWPECTDGFMACLAEVIESVNRVMLLTLERLQAFTMAAQMAYSSVSGVVTLPAMYLAWWTTSPCLYIRYAEAA